AGTGGVRCHVAICGGAGEAHRASCRQEQRCSRSRPRFTGHVLYENGGYSCPRQDHHSAGSGTLNGEARVARVSRTEPRWRDPWSPGNDRLVDIATGRDVAAAGWTGVVVV